MSDVVAHEALVRAVEDRLGAYGIPETVGHDGDAVLARAALGGIEDAWDVTVPNRLLDEVRERAVLARVIADRVWLQQRRRAGREPLVLRGTVRVRLSLPAGSPGRATTMSGRLDPYDLEQLVEQAARAERGARLEIEGGEADLSTMQVLRERVEARTGGAIEVAVRTVA